MTRRIQQARIMPAECLICEPVLSGAATLAIVLPEGSVHVVGHALQDKFCRLVWRDHGLSPRTIATLASEDLLREIRLPHPCGEFAVFSCDVFVKLCFHIYSLIIDSGVLHFANF